MILKLVNLNLWFGGEMFSELLDFLLAEQPDLLTLQEVYDGRDPILDKQYRSVQILEEVLDLPYHTFSPAFDEIKPFGLVTQGNAIFSRFPLTKLQTIFFDVPYGERDKSKGPIGNSLEFTPRNMQHVLLHTPNGQIVNVFNTQGIWGKDGNDNERRLQMADTIIDAIHDKDKVILAGDFNVQENTETIRRITCYLNNVFEGELTTTFNIRRKSNPVFASAVVDMVFVSKNIETKSHSCPDVDISDHLPLIVELDL